MAFTAQGSMFEGLYERVLKPTGDFKAKLKQAGYDLDRPLPSYPITVWIDCLDVTWRELHPGLQRFAAWERIGEDFIQGFLQTIVGKLIAVVMPMLSPKAFVQRSPRFIKSGLPEVETDVEWLGPTEALVTLHGPHEGGGYVLVGVIRVCLRRMGVEPVITCQDSPGRSQLRIAWSTEAAAQPSR